MAPVPPVSACASCAERIDALRAHHRIEGTRIVTLCASCASGAPRKEPTAVPQSEIAETGELDDFSLRGSIPVRWTAVLAGVAALGALAAFYPRAEAQLPREAVIEVPARPTPVIESSEWDLVGEEASLALDLAELGELEEAPSDLGEVEWIHPLPDAEQIVPSIHSRRFGAERPGSRPSECRRGHCGVDLEDARGAPIVSVADGTVLRAERSAHARGGRYVRVAHDNGTITSYFHLDDVASGLSKGDRVFAGQFLGSLGRTGIKRSVPHLHFSLEAMRDGNLRYIDPEDLLLRARTIGLLDMRAGVQLSAR